MEVYEKVGYPIKTSHIGQGDAGPVALPREDRRRTESFLGDMTEAKLFNSYNMRQDRKRTTADWSLGYTGMCEKMDSCHFFSAVVFIIQWKNT